MSTLLSINNYYYRRGGADVAFLEQNRLFQDIGWHVVPFSMRHPKNLDSPWSEYFVNELEFGNEHSVLTKLILATKVIYSFEARRKLRRLIETVKPNISHLHNIYHHISPAILSMLRRYDIPVVITLHDLKLACPAYKMLNEGGICERCREGRLYNVVVNKCVKTSLTLSTLVFLESSIHRLLGTYEKNVDRFIVPSQFYLNKMLEWGFNPSKFVYIPNFVDIDKFVPTNKVGRTFLYVGRLGPEKGIATLIKAASKAQVPLRIVGIGPEEEKLQRLVEQLGSKVTFLGYLIGDALHHAIREARAVVIPSEWYENAPISMLESYALGVPVIGAAIGGIPELIKTNETGLIFDSGSIDDLASALRYMSELSDADVLRLGNLGRAWVETEFTKIHYRDRLLNLYSMLNKN